VVYIPRGGLASPDFGRIFVTGDLVLGGARERSPSLHVRAREYEGVSPPIAFKLNPLSGP
jgi:hypothetical protein